MTANAVSKKMHSSHCQRLSPVHSHNKQRGNASHMYANADRKMRDLKTSIWTWTNAQHTALTLRSVQ